MEKIKFDFLRLFIKIKNLKMRKLFLFVIFLYGCNPFVKVWEETSIKYGYPNWTSDNKIVFLEWIARNEYRKDRWMGGTTVNTLWEEVWLWEVDTLQNYRRIGLVWRTENGEKKRFPTNTSSAGDWVVIGVWDYKNGEIWRIKRDGTGAEVIGKGVFPDLSPDGSKLVYQKKYWDSQSEEEVGQGLWIMNIDGTNDHQIIPDPNATHPAWSSEGGRIAFYVNYKGLLLGDTNGTIMDSFGFRHFPDWGPPDSNAIVATLYSIDRGVIIYVETHKEDTLNIKAYEWPIKWSLKGNYFISYRTIYSRDGTKIFTIEP